MKKIKFKGKILFLETEKYVEKLWLLRKNLKKSKKRLDFSEKV